MKEQDIQRYFDKSGDDKIADGNIEENEHGWCVWKTNGTRLILVQVYGDGDYWDTWATIKCKELGLKSVLFATKRKPMAFVRKYKYTIIGTVLERYV